MSEQLNKEVWDKAVNLADRPYIIKVTLDTLTNGDQVYILEHPEFPGLMTQGDTYEEAREELDEARTDFIYFMLVDGFEVPEPATYSVSASSVQVGNSFENTSLDRRIIENDKPQIIHREWAFA